MMQLFKNRILSIYFSPLSLSFFNNYNKDKMIRIKSFLYNGFHYIFLTSSSLKKKTIIMIKKSSKQAFYNEAVLFFNLIKAEGEITPKRMHVPFIRIIEKKTQRTGRLRIAVKMRFPQTIFFMKALHPDMV